ncbi:hypothetical protein DY000_02044832 [Brassica cretica]|uniref:CCHC-type domain-containing protein n=1 Tax=Brassica cretica TaxID=69181 RepID=A0ABQ7F243_BRACR|nr:hypothetical protein DY000_02044832 [Brassica cretica]
MANPWLTVALASPLNPTAPAGNLSRPPPLPDPPDPDLFSLLSSSRSAPSKASRRLSHTAPSTSASTVYLPSSTPITTDLARPPPALSNTTSPLPISSTAQLLAYYTVILPSASNPNPFSPPAHPVSFLPTQPPSAHNPGILPSPYPIFSSAIPFPPVTDNTVPFNTITNPSHQTAPPKTSISWVSKAKPTTDRTLKRLSPQTFSPEGVPRVTIPDEVYRKGAELHKDFIVCRFFGRVPAYSLIQNVFNYMWGKSKHLEIRMIPNKKYVLVRLPNDFIREKVLLKRLWYVDTAMFHASRWSEFSDDYTPSLKRIQLWAHLKGVPFDLIYDEGLSHIAGQIGDPKETDDWTLNLSSISVAHVKVEIDILQSLSQRSWNKEIGHIQRNCLLLPPPTPAPANNLNNPPASAKKPPSVGLSTCYSCNTVGHLIRNCPKGLKGPNDWIKVSHKKKSVPQTSETPITRDSTMPPTSSDNPLHTEAPITILSPEKEPLSQMEIDPAFAGKLISPLSTQKPQLLENVSEQNADPAGTFVLGLAAVFKDRPIITSNSFSALPPSDNHTATNPFTLPKPLTSADLSKPPDAIPEPSEPSVVNQSLTLTPPFTVISPRHHTDPFVFGSIPQPLEASTPSTLALIPSPTQEEEPSI